MTGLAVIPDLHADAERLSRSLRAADGARPAFVGDFIDALGSKKGEDRAVLEQVRGLVEDGAPAVMGNHEMNAILFHRTGRDGLFLREHSQKNRAQHRSFVRAFGVATPDALDWTGWFLTLPLWYEAKGMRLVHAAWDDEAIATIAARRPDGRLRERDLEEVAEKRSNFARAVDRLLTGPELQLPNGRGFKDHKGQVQDSVRIAWWRPDARTWDEAALSIDDRSCLPDAPLPDHDISFYPDDVPPVFCGHYKMTGTPRVERQNVACLDYPDTPCLYSWRGEARLSPANLRIV